jgi:hypothetical protein
VGPDVYISFCVDALESLQQLFAKPLKFGASLGVKQVAGTAAVVIRRAETGNGNAKLRSLLQEFGPVVLELLVCGRVPDLDGFSGLKQMRAPSPPAPKALPT